MDEYQAKRYDGQILTLTGIILSASSCLQGDPTPHLGSDGCKH